MLLNKRDVNPTEDIGGWDLILRNLIIKNVVVMINFKIVFKDFFFLLKADNFVSTTRQSIP